MNVHLLGNGLLQHVQHGLTPGLSTLINLLTTIMPTLGNSLQQDKSLYYYLDFTKLFDKTSHGTFIIELSGHDIYKAPLKIMVHNFYCNRERMQ